VQPFPPLRLHHTPFPRYLFDVAKRLAFSSSHPNSLLTALASNSCHSLAQRGPCPPLRLLCLFHNTQIHLKFFPPPPPPFTPSPSPPPLLRLFVRYSLPLDSITFLPPHLSSAPPLLHCRHPQPPPSCPLSLPPTLTPPSGGRSAKVSLPKRETLFSGLGNLGVLTNSPFCKRPVIIRHGLSRIWTL